LVRANQFAVRHLLEELCDYDFPFIVYIATSQQL
jgi:hypothetical protein